MDWDLTDRLSKSQNTEGDGAVRAEGETTEEGNSASDAEHSDEQISEMSGTENSDASAFPENPDENQPELSSGEEKTDAQREENVEGAPPEEGESTGGGTAECTTPVPSDDGTHDTHDMHDTYDTQDTQDSKRRGGILTYAIVMTVCFVVSLAVLAAALLWDGMGTSGNGSSGNVSDRVVYVRELDKDSGVLTVQEIASRGSRSVVAISTRKQTVVGYTTTGVGTGIIMTSDGYIATNYHVVSGAEEIRVQDYDGNSYEGKVIGYSEIDDLAVVKIQASGLNAVTFGSSADVLVGDSVVVIGHPAGLEFGWSTTQGIISAINREVKIKDASGTLTKKMTLLQTSANVNSGNSGGPMFNERGEVIGIITLKLADQYEGMGFAIPSDGALEILQAIIKDGNASGVDSSVSSGRPVLGVVCVAVQADNYYVMGEDRISSVTEEQAKEAEGSFFVAYSGVLITEVQEDQDAFGKLMEGDIIVALNGTGVSNMYTLRELLYDCNVGDTVTVELMRGDVRKSVQVRLGVAK